MKKLGAFLVGVSLVAGVAAAANTATSVNGVGFETFSVAGGQSVMIRLDFEKVGGGYWLAKDVFGTNSTLPITVYYWDTGTSGWLSENWLPDDQVWDPGTTHFTRGQSLFVSVAGSPAVTNKFVVSGEIPGANNNAASATLPLVQGFNGVAYSYPSSIAITNTTLSAAAGGGDLSIYYWNNGWLSVNWLNDDGIWDPSSFVLQPGQGVLVYKFGAGTTSWAETKPYNWP